MDPGSENNFGRMGWGRTAVDHHVCRPSGATLRRDDGEGTHDLTA